MRAVQFVPDPLPCQAISDLALSTLLSHVEAMGGNLSLTFEFPGQGTVVLEGLGDTERLQSRR